MTQMLRVDGARIVAGSDPVVLRGFGLGGWMNMENFITGYAGTESQQRRALRGVLGEEGYERFFARFLSVFFTDEDAAFLQSLGLNSVRIPFNYRHFESDDAPFEIREEGFRLLDSVVDACARHGIYAILDLHALPGAQNQHWHSDNPTQWAHFWSQRQFQDRVVNLWEHIADHYRGNPWVAGYNPVNEPADAEGSTIGPFYRRLEAAIRAVDADHILFLDGNRYSTQFDQLGDPLPNCVYTAHDYALPGFVDGGPYPGVSRGQYVDRDRIEETFLARTQYMRDSGTPIWVGRVRPGVHRRPRSRRAAPSPPRGPARDLRPVRRELGPVDLQGHRPAGRGHRRSRLRVHDEDRSVPREEEPARRRLVGLDRRRACVTSSSPSRRCSARSSPTSSPTPGVLTDGSTAMCGT